MPAVQARRRKRTFWGVSPLHLLLALLLGVLLGLFFVRLAPPGWIPLAGSSAEAASPLESLPAFEDEDEDEDSGRTDGATVQPHEFRIVDGDTFWVGREKIRVADIDTPEVQGKCPYERALAARATDRMEALLSEGPFELERLGSRDEDRYGRKLRIVTRGGRSLGDQMVAEGLARTWSGRREPWCT